MSTNTTKSTDVGVIFSDRLSADQLKFVLSKLLRHNKALLAKITLHIDPDADTVLGNLKNSLRSFLNAYKNVLSDLILENLQIVHDTMTPATILLPWIAMINGLPFTGTDNGNNPNSSECSPPAKRSLRTLYQTPASDPEMQNKYTPHSMEKFERLQQNSINLRSIQSAANCWLEILTFVAESIKNNKLLNNELVDENSVTNINKINQSILHLKEYLNTTTASTFNASITELTEIEYEVKTIEKQIANVVSILSHKSDAEEDKADNEDNLEIISKIQNKIHETKDKYAKAESDINDMRIELNELNKLNVFNVHQESKRESALPIPTHTLYTKVDERISDDEEEDELRKMGGTTGDISIDKNTASLNDESASAIVMDFKRVASLLLHHPHTSDERSKNTIKLMSKNVVTVVSRSRQSECTSPTNSSPAILNMLRGNLSETSFDSKSFSGKTTAKKLAAQFANHQGVVLQDIFNDLERFYTATIERAMKISLELILKLLGSDLAVKYDTISKNCPDWTISSILNELNKKHSRVHTIHSTTLLAPRDYTKMFFDERNYKLLSISKMIECTSELCDTITDKELSINFGTSFDEALIANSRRLRGELEFDNSAIHDAIHTLKEFERLLFQASDQRPALEEFRLRVQSTRGVEAVDGAPEPYTRIELYTYKRKKDSKYLITEQHFILNWTELKKLAMPYSLKETKAEREKLNQYKQTLKHLHVVKHHVRKTVNVLCNNTHSIFQNVNHEIHNVCFDFQNNGSCSRKDCKYDHIKRSGKPNSSHGGKSGGKSAGAGRNQNQLTERQVVYTMGKVLKSNKQSDTGASIMIKTHDNSYNLLEVIRKGLKDDTYYKSLNAIQQKQLVNTVFTSGWKAIYHHGKKLQ